MKKLLSILFFIFVTQVSYGQTFTQTFVDRCTGEVQVVTANFQTGSAVVSFYNKVRVFTYQEYVNGTLQSWLIETYNWWNTLSPCSTTTTQATQAQQTANQAQQQANQAQNAANNASSSANSAASTANNTTNATNQTNTTNTGSTNTSGSTSNGNTSSGSTSNGGSSDSGSTSSNSTGGDSSNTNNTEGNNNDTSNGNDNSSNEGSSGGDNTEGNNNDSSGSSDSDSNDSSGGNNEGESEGGGESSEEGSDGGSEDSETESTSEESSEEEVNEESKEEENKEEESKEEESEEESSEEESEEDSEESDEESSEETEEEGEKKKMLPIQLRADAMAMQTPLGMYNAVMNIGASQSSIFGDVSYNANVMIWDNLKQISILASRAKINIVTPNITNINHDTHKHYANGKSVNSSDSQTPPQPYVSHITSFSLGYANNYGYSTISTSYSAMKPFKSGLVVGGVLSASTSFVSYPIKESGLMISYNLLATKPFKIGSRITYSPTLIWSQTPYIGKPSWPNTNAFVFGIDMNNELRGTEIDGMVILSNSFTIQLTRRFSFNAGWTLVNSTNPEFPMINSFMIGAKLPF